MSLSEKSGEKERTLANGAGLRFPEQGPGCALAANVAGEGAFETAVGVPGEHVHPRCGRSSRWLSNLDADSSTPLQRASNQLEVVQLDDTPRRTAAQPDR